MGAPKQNVNAVKHGARSARGKRFGIVHARLGRRFASAYHDCLRLRKAVESLVREQPGGLNLVRTARIQTLLAAEETARGCELMIRENPKMPVPDFCRLREMIGRYRRERDSILKELLGASAGQVASGDADDWPAPGEAWEVWARRVGLRDDDDGQSEGDPEETAPQAAWGAFAKGGSQAGQGGPDATAANQSDHTPQQEGDGRSDLDLI